MRNTAPANAAGIGFLIVFSLASRYRYALPARLLAVAPAAVLTIFPVPANLALGDCAGFTLAVVSPLRQQRRRGGFLEGRRHCLTQILKHRLALLTTRRHHCPDPLAPAPALDASRSLREQPIDHHKADRLLRRLFVGAT